MDKKITYGILVYIVIFAISMSTRVFASREGLNMMLFCMAPFAATLVATDMKPGFFWALS
jgi:hypothetical protein